MPAPTDLITICTTTLQKLRQHMEKSPYNYYGIISFDTFYLKNTTVKSAQVKGRNCSTTHLWELFYLISKLNNPIVARDGDKVISFPKK